MFACAAVISWLLLFVSMIAGVAECVALVVVVCAEVRVLSIIVFVVVFVVACDCCGWLCCCFLHV